MTELDVIDATRTEVAAHDKATPRALHLIEEGLKLFPRSSRLWILRGDLIQVSDEVERYALADALPLSSIRAARRRTSRSDTISMLWRTARRRPSYTFESQSSSAAENQRMTGSRRCWSSLGVRRKRVEPPNTRVQRIRAPWLAGLGLIISACASREAPPTHFGPWGRISPVREPERSVLVAAITALTAANAESVVLARYAGDLYERLDLASLSNQVPVAVDVGGQLGPIDAGVPKYRAKVFELDFRGKTTILEVSAPKLNSGWATMTAWLWDALAWKCDLPGKAEHLTLKLENKHWSVTVTSTDPKALLLQTDCP